MSRDRDEEEIRNEAGEISKKVEVEVDARKKKRHVIVA